jgi:hypothetical protein
MKHFYLVLGINRMSLAENESWFICKAWGVDCMENKIRNKKVAESLHKELSESHSHCQYKIIRCEEI